MSLVEDTELRDLVSQILEKNGVLAKIRAELRANVYLTLEEQSSELKQSFENHALKNYLTTPGSALGLCLVREFLEYLDLDNTLVVFNTESHHGKDYEYKGRESLVKELQLDKFKDRKCPILSLLIQIAKEALGSTPSQKTEEGQEAGDFETSNIQSPKAAMPPITSYVDSSNAPLDKSHNLLNQTFTTGVLVTSFGSPDNSIEKPTETSYQPYQSKDQDSNGKKPLSTISNDNSNREEPEELKGKDEIKREYKKSLPKDKLSVNSQTSLSNLPPLTENRCNKNTVSEQKQLFNELLGIEGQDHYEEDFSSESSGAGDREGKLKSGRNETKKDVEADGASNKDQNSPVASVSEELEGDTNSGTEDVPNSAASGDTLDSSLSFLGTKHADHIESI